MKIKAVLEYGEHVVEQFPGGISSGQNEFIKGTWYITNRRLIHLPAVRIRYTWKDALIGGLLSAYSRGRKEAERFEAYNLDDLKSIDVVDGQPKRLVAAFHSHIPGHGNETTYIMTEADKPHDLKSRIENTYMKRPQ